MPADEEDEPPYPLDSGGDGLEYWQQRCLSAEEELLQLQSAASDAADELDALRVENSALKMPLGGAEGARLTMCKIWGNNSLLCLGLAELYESVSAENEMLRAKLGSLGQPTEGAPEEDPVTKLSTINEVKFNSII